MNRVIKFRAWDGHRMWFEVQNAYDYIHGEIANKDDQIPATYFGEIVDGKHEWVPMQFTGLIDKDGKEIYEGDILSFEIPRTTSMNKKPTIHHHEMYWNGDKGQWWIRHGEMHQAIGSHSSEYQVIGNIYENPELLGV